MKKKVKNAVFIIFVILAAVILFGCQDNNSGNKTTKSMSFEGVTEEDENENENENEKDEIGYAAPNFTVELVSGETVKLSDLRGKVVFINFWATWCGPCVNEMPDIQKLADAFPDDLVVLAINCSEKKDKIEKFVSDNGYTFNVGLDEKGKISGKYPTSKSIPYTVIVDADGIIAATHIGASGDMFSVYEADVKEVLGK
jgi:thiol-disulfide isomerase/thioredoxin